MDTFLVFTILLSLLIRWSVSRWPHSGQSKAPMYGDYEAQRHWMEVTVNLKVNDWYKNSSENDLLYWGLDYPPLTAYHSLLNGGIARSLNKSWISLHESRGMESYEHKLFMRSTVLFSDAIVYIPAVIWFWFMISNTYEWTQVSEPLVAGQSIKNRSDRSKGIKNRSDRSKDVERSISIAIMTTLMYPGLILIDHGHFQYNCISLGLTVIAITFILRSNLTLASVFFVLALNYKQMSLYHSLPFFFYILASVIRKGNAYKCFKALTMVGGAVVLTFSICWLPFLTSIENASNVLKRLFPVHRGLYEDKVANFWCVVGVVFKFQTFLAPIHLVKISAITTLASVLPSGLSVLVSPSFDAFRYNLVISSFGFFLFSYQVHEKSILLVALPILLLLDRHPLPVLWFSIVSTFSLQPLLVKDELLIPSVALSVLFLVLFTSLHGDLGLSNNSSPRSKLTTVLFVSSIYGCITLTLIQVLIAPPSKYPDLWTVANCAYSFVHFIAFYAYFNCQQISKFNDMYEKIVSKLSHLLFPMEHAPRSDQAEKNGDVSKSSNVSKGSKVSKQKSS